MLSGVAGGVLLYTALFLYPDEQGQIQNKLEEWWVRLTDLQRLSLTRHGVFLSQVGRLAGSPAGRS
jgi:hypothetical protein